MNCQTCIDHLPELADARLDEKTAALARAHLEGCPGCRAEYESLRRTLEALDALPAAAPSHRLRARVMGDIEAEKLTLRSQAGWASSIRAAADARRGRRFALAPLLLPALGACALVALGFMLGERTATQRQLADLRSRVTRWASFSSSPSCRRAPPANAWRPSSRPARPAGPTTG